MPSVGEEQVRNLRIILALAALLVLALISAGWAVYLGMELPPAEMRSYATSSTGYAPPPGSPTSEVGPTRQTVPTGTVARGMLAASGPDLPPVGAAGEPVPPVVDIIPNPLAGGATVVAQGQKAYAVNCAMCHGEPGKGMGPVGEAYIPKPPDLAARVPSSSDGRLYYQITAGIRSTPTPEAAEYLPEDWHSVRNLTTAQDRWAIITYLRRVYPPR